MIVSFSVRDTQHPDHAFLERGILAKPPSVFGYIVDEVMEVLVGRDAFPSPIAKLHFPVRRDGACERIN